MCVCVSSLAFQLVELMTFIFDAHLKSDAWMFFVLRGWRCVSSVSFGIFAAELIVEKLYF